jgi:glycosyltransferase involved in cell wall biosynthesis
LESNNQKVSIIITAYNYIWYLEQCIKSCIFQSYQPIEIVIADDCSTDGTKEYLRTLNPLPGIEFVTCSHTKNKGIAASKNTGIIKSTGDLITFIDADDMLTPNSIADRVKQFVKHPELDFVHGQAFHVEDKSGHKHTYDQCLKNAFRLHGKKTTVNAQAVMVRKEVFVQHGLFLEDRKMHSREDKEMWYRLGVHPKSPLPKLVNHKKIKAVCAYSRVHEVSAKHSRTPEQKKQLDKVFKARIKHLKKFAYENKN